MFFNPDHTSCAPDKFQCTDQRCINKNWQCDFDSDCPDGSDEENCSYNCKSVWCWVNINLELLSLMAVIRKTAHTIVSQFGVSLT